MPCSLGPGEAWLTNEQFEERLKIEEQAKRIEAERRAKQVQTDGLKPPKGFGPDAGPIIYPTGKVYH